MIYVFDSSVGKVREENQDCCDAFMLGDAVFAVVADGMGGAVGGSTASKITVECVRKMIADEYKENMSDAKLISLLTSCCNYANAQVYEYSQKNKELDGMGTTIVLSAVRKGKALIANVADSRAYFVGDGEAKQITKDQSYVQYLVDKGEISEMEAKNHPRRNVIMQALGTEQTIKPDIYEFKYDGQSVLLCSDGLSNKVLGTDIAKVIEDSSLLPQQKVEKLIHMANDAGGEDNISAVLIMKK